MFIDILIIKSKRAKDLGPDDKMWQNILSDLEKSTYSSVVMI